MSANTVKTPVSDRLLRDGDDVVPWGNKEVIPLLRELRAVANYQETYKIDVVTSGDGSNVIAWESEVVPTNGDWLMEMRHFGVSANGNHQAAVRTHHWKFVAGAGTIVSSANTLTSLGGFPGLPTFSFDSTKGVMHYFVRDDGSVSHFSGIVRIQEIRL